jgi:hypothetical protein
MPHQRQRRSDRLRQSKPFLVCRSVLPSCCSAYARFVRRRDLRGNGCCWRSSGRRCVRGWERRLGRTRPCKSMARSATENIISEFWKTYLNNRRAFSLFLNRWSNILPWVYGQRIDGGVRTIVFSWRRRQDDNMLIRQNPAVRENQTFAVEARIVLSLAELAGHLGQSMHAVIIPSTAERSKAAEESEWSRCRE